MLCAPPASSSVNVVLGGRCRSGHHQRTRHRSADSGLIALAALTTGGRHPDIGQVHDIDPRRNALGIDIDHRGHIRRIDVDTQICCACRVQFGRPLRMSHRNKDIRVSRLAFAVRAIFAAFDIDTFPPASVSIIRQRHDGNRLETIGETVVSPNYCHQGGADRLAKALGIQGPFGKNRCCCE